MAAITLRAADGTELAGQFFEAKSPRGAVMIVPAMGVPQTFYAPLCTWLVEQGHHAMTFDYRGSGLSRRGSLRVVDADIVTWGRLDTTAALRALQDRAGDLPVTWIGHSLGGQIIPFVPDHVELSRIVTIATGSGYWRENATPLRRKVWLFWFVMAPLATPLFGYFPGKLLKTVGDLPRGVIRQWRKWCLNPEYAVGAEGDAVRELYAKVKTPITSLAFTDDEMMSEANIRSIHAHYTGSRVELQRIAPEDLGLSRIGHFGFFREAMRPAWDTLLAPLLTARESARFAR